MSALAWSRHVAAPLTSATAGMPCYGPFAGRRQEDDSCDGGERRDVRIGRWQDTYVGPRRTSMSLSTAAAAHVDERAPLIRKSSPPYTNRLGGSIVCLASWWSAAAPALVRRAARTAPRTTAHHAGRAVPMCGRAPVEASRRWVIGRRAAWSGHQRGPRRRAS